MRRWGALVVVVMVCAAACAGDDDGPSLPRIDAATIDADPACIAVNSSGGFPDCSVCDAIGAGCDTIDKNGQVFKVCDCTAPCPCGLSCGDIVIAPGVTVGNVCTR
jgi:hypothetical protein